MRVPANEIQDELIVARHRLRWLSGILRSRLALWLQRAFPVLLFLFGLFLIVHLLAFTADNLAMDANTRFLSVDRQHIRRILAAANRIDVLVLGNSHAGSVEMDALGFNKGYRFARADGDLFEVGYALEYLAPRLPNLKLVLIPVSYFSFLEENSSSEEVSIRRTHLYASIPGGRFMKGDLSNWVIGKSHVYFPISHILREDNWEGVLFALLGRQEEQKSFIEVESGDCSSLRADQMAASVENRVAKYMRLTHEMAVKRPGLEQETYNHLVKIYQTLQSRGVQVVFYTPPYWHEYTAAYQTLDPDVISRMRDNMSRLQSETGALYYDFSEDQSFVLDPTLFKDSDHLNSCGARLFSARLRQVLVSDLVAAP